MKDKNRFNHKSRANLLVTSFFLFLFIFASLVYGADEIDQIKQESFVLDETHFNTGLKFGYIIFINSYDDVLLESMHKDPVDQSTQAWIVNGTTFETISTSDFVGSVATFGNVTLQARTFYRISGYHVGNANIRRKNGGGVYPVNNTYVSYVQSCYSGYDNANCSQEDVTNVAYTFDYINISEIVNYPSIDFSTFNVTSALQNGTNPYEWQTSQLKYVVTEDSTPTIIFETDINSNCSISLYDFNHTGMINNNSDTECSTSETTEHSCTLPLSEALSFGEQSIYIACFGGNGDRNESSTSGNLNIELTDATNPSINFISQNPADLDSGSFGNTTIIYNITDTNGINDSSIKFWHKTNTTLKDYSVYVNANPILNFIFGDVIIGIAGSLYSFIIDETQIFPASYNINESYMENTAHSTFLFDGTNEQLKIELFNVQSDKNYSFFELMASKENAGSSELQIYYCNSSYTTGSVITSNFCTRFYDLTADSYNHAHSEYSSHHVIPFIVNQANFSINHIAVSNQSYFILRPTSADGWNVHYIPAVSRADAMQTTATSGAVWSNFAGTFDAHIHQYDGTETFNYIVEACDIYDNCDNSTLRYDLLEQGNLPPSSPLVYEPATSDTFTINGSMNISYTESISPNNYSISNYNITLVDTSNDFVAFIGTTSDLNFTWSPIPLSLVAGSYKVKVRATDSIGQYADGYSGVFTIQDLPSEEAEITVSIFDFDLTQQTNVLLLFVLVILYIGLMVIAFFFKNFGFASFGFFIGMVVGLLFYQLHIFLTLAFLFLNIGMFIKYATEFR